MNSILESISRTGIVAVVSVAPDKAVDLGRALLKGGVPVMEITFRQEGADRAIAAVSAELPDVLVGAGTVLSVEQAEKAVKSGAKFIVAPGFDRELVDYCVKAGVPVVPGCATPSEVNEAVKAGLEAVKFFPAETSGGIGMLKSLAGPYRNMKFIPTGGINPDNIGEYLKQKNVCAVGGTFIAPSKLIEKGDFEQIEANARKAVMSVLGFKIIHVGVNEDDKEKAERTAALFEMLFGFESRETAISYFAGSDIEVMSGGGRGRCGHLGIATNNISIAMEYIKGKGFEFAPETARYDAAGNITFIYLKDDIGGFAVHVNQRQ